MTNGKKCPLGVSKGVERTGFLYGLLRGTENNEAVNTMLAIFRS